jgi:hypothetical protein
VRYDLRLKGAAFPPLARCEWRDAEDGYRVFLADGLGPDTLFVTARECAVQVRHLRPGAESLEDVFLRALGESGAA